MKRLLWLLAESLRALIGCFGGCLLHLAFCCIEALVLMCKLSLKDALKTAEADGQVQSDRNLARLSNSKRTFLLCQLVCFLNLLFFILYSNK